MVGLFQNSNLSFVLLNILPIRIEHFVDFLDCYVALILCALSYIYLPILAIA